LNNNNVLKNTLMLTASGIIAKSIDFFFRTFQSKRLGSEGTGLLSLVFTAHSIMLTLASAGISVAVAKTISSCISQRDMSAAKKTMRAALMFTFFSSVLVITAVFFRADYISLNILKDSRTKIPLLYLTPSILFMGLSYSFKGYFYSVRKILIPATSEFVEQFVKITVITALLDLWLPKGIEYGCRAVFLGLTIGEASSFTYLAIFYYKESQKFKDSGILHKSRKPSAYISLLKIALPAMICSLSGSYLHMQEELLIVSGLKKYGLSPSAALSAYGTISGMIIPLTVFPLSLLSSFLTLLVPEISRASARTNKIRLMDLSAKVYKFASIGSFLITTVFFSLPSEIIKAVYNLEDVENTLIVFATLLPVILIDSVSHGILNGLGKQMVLLFITVSECLIRIFICLFAVPKIGASAIILTVYTGSIFSFGIKLLCVLIKTGLLFKAFEWIFLPFSISVFSSFLSGIIYRTNLFINVSLPVKIIITASIYIFLSLIFNFIKKDEILWVRKRLKIR